MTEETEKTGRNWCGCHSKGWWFLVPVIAAAAIFLFGTIVMYLWNAIIPAIFTSVGTITFWQAIGLLILSKILFGGFRRGCRGGWRGRRHNMYWKEKWMNMSEEEKAKFKEEWKNKWQGGRC